MKTGSQQKSSSTAGPPELETPEEITDYTSDLTGLVPTPAPAPPEGARTEAATPEVLLAQQGIAMPRVTVIEDGQEKAGPLDPATLNMVTQLAQLGQLNRIRKAMEREQFQGKLLSKTLEATEEYQAFDLTKQDPYFPWATATFKNDGPNTAYLAINRMRPYHTLEKGETLPADFTKGDTRIYYLEYYCDAGQTASIRSLGKY